MVDLATLLSDLAAESAEVDGLVAGLPADRWATPTPAAGWTIAHQIAHLAWTDRETLLAVNDPDAFTARQAAVLESIESYVDDGARATLAEPAELLARWRSGRSALSAALAGTTMTKIPWYVTAMSPATMVTARLMETWAHGLDIAEALGAAPTPTDRLRHIAHMGYRTLGWGFVAHGRPAPSAPVLVELTAPDGALWTYGPAEAEDRLTGPAIDFCLLVTQRRHPADLALVAHGPVAREWLQVAQVFAGPPGAGRPATTATATATGSGADAGAATGTGSGDG
jgi:uncharacterized protein (TIGR03084 family)